ncbi:MAG: hypothetical protein HQM08_13100 [Candidatus Riflebacteria bacterium]|nr:hypothetical protein [Candidatus Riflebacteria bacterium]
MLIFRLPRQRMHSNSSPKAFLCHRQRSETILALNRIFQKAVFLFFFLLLIPHPGFPQIDDLPLFDLPDKNANPGNPELILPMPSQHGEKDGTFLHLPGTKNILNQKIVEKAPAPQGNKPPLAPPSGELPLASPNKPHPPKPEASLPPNPANLAPNQVSNSPGSQKLPVFPKDTSSAIFMVMKSWECKDYDGHTFLNHSIGVYGQEVEDRYELKGLTEIKPFKLTLKEDDVTLDELLDSISSKTGLDWGVDIPNKAIYFYPGKS